MKRERIEIKPGDFIRCPDRATARWREVLRVGRRRDGSRYVVLRRSRIGRLLGLPAKQVLEWALLKGVGFGVRRSQAAALTAETPAQEVKSLPEVSENAEELK